MHFVSPKVGTGSDPVDSWYRYYAGYSVGFVEQALIQTAPMAGMILDPWNGTGTRFCDGCVSCPLFRFCREEADSEQLTSRLGADVAGSCGSVTTIGHALDLAAGRRTPESAAEAAVAYLLARGAAAARLANPGMPA